MKLLIYFLLSVFLLFLHPYHLRADYPIDSLGKTIYSGVFTGNGLLGTMSYLKDDKTIRIDVGRTDVYDHRHDETFVLFSRPRLPIGHFEIVFDKNIHASGIISITDADGKVFIKNNKGAIKIKTVTLSQNDLILIEIDKRNYDGGYQVNFVPEVSGSPRIYFSHVKKPENYKPNPAPIMMNKGEVYYINQTMSAGGGYATAYKAQKLKDKDRYAVTISYDTSNNNYLDRAINKVNSFSFASVTKELSKHQKWWKEYMALSDYRIPDQKMQDFYRMQMYKLACGTRSEKPALDLQGPWTAPTPWPGYWHNLNIQLTYSPLYTANRLSIAASLIKLLENNRKNLVQNVHPDYRYNSMALGRTSDPFLNAPLQLHLDKNDMEDIQFSELGNLTWALYYYYQHYRYSMDESLKQPLYDLLKKSTNYAIHFLKKNNDGKYEFIVKTHSPEYPNSYDYNTNYDLSIFRWGIKALKDLSHTMPEEKKYIESVQEILDHLIDYPKDKTGFKISSNQSYDVSHRHYSHLMMIYPFYLVNAEQQENLALINQSIEHWQSKTGALQGYSLSGAASMYAMMGNGNVAYSYLQQLLTRFVKPNTLYAETGPVIETPLAAAASLQELSLQYWDGIVRVFPAIPDSWQDVSFDHFRTDGAFLISAVRKNGKNRTVKIFSEYGGSIKIKPNLHGEISWKSSNKNVALLQENRDIYSFYIPKGAIVELEAP